MNQINDMEIKANLAHNLLLVKQLFDNKIQMFLRDNIACLCLCVRLSYESLQWLTICR